MNLKAANTHSKINWNIEEIRNDFPILEKLIHNKKLCYLDNAATTQKPNKVIEILQRYYKESNSNIHRGVHSLSEEATAMYEQAREKTKNFINAETTEEIIFTRGTTESINLIASSFGKKNLKAGDEILITEMEHHSNIVPWQLIAEQTGAKLKVVPISDGGEILMDEFYNMLSEKTKIVSVVYVSNSLGTINPVKQIIDTAHKFNVPVLVDGAQAIQHLNIDVQKLDCDFFAFSGHKIYGPTGIGILYGKKKYLEDLPPYMGGGDMISSVTFEKTTYNSLPYKFEAGTPNIAGAIGLGAAIDYVSNLGINNIYNYEDELLKYAQSGLSAINGLRIIGTAKEKCSVISFVLENVHPHDVGTFLDFDGIAIRTGHHCTQPVMDRFRVPATSRASFALYNTFEEIDKLASSIKKLIEVFK